MSRRFENRSGGWGISLAPAAEGHGLWPWLYAPSIGRDVAPQGRSSGIAGFTRGAPRVPQIFGMESAHFNAHVLAVPGKRYLKKDGAGGVIESPEEMFWRVARNVAEAERFYSTNSSPEELSEAFFRMMASLDNLVKTRKDCHCERSEAISPPITH